MDEAKTNTSTATPDSRYGWTCPKCGKAWAPWIPSCDCSGYQWTVTAGNEWWKPPCTISSDTFKIHTEDGPWYTSSWNEYNTYMWGKGD